jgi:hypothetical protein
MQNFLQLAVIEGEGAHMADKNTAYGDAMDLS